MITTILSLLGSGLGALLRLAPEIIKLFETKADREHEYRMTQLQLEIDKTRAQMQIDAIHAVGQENEIVEQMKAYTAAVKAQGRLTGVRWIDALSSSVRPFITYWWMTLFTFYKGCVVYWAAKTSETFPVFMSAIWTPKDWGILSTIIGFWFVDRVYRRRNE